MNDASEVKLHFLDYWRIIKLRAGLIVLAFLLVMVTGGVTTYFVPRQYYAKVTMEVKPDKALIEVFNNSQRGGNDVTFIPTQFAVLRKKTILYKVIDNLKLVEKWSGEGQKPLPLEFVYNKLMRMMDPREVRNTSLIEIGVFSTDAQEAANIANQIAIVYKEDRLNRLTENIERALGQLRDEVEKQRKLAEESGAEVAAIRERDNIVDSDPESMVANVREVDRDVFAIEKDRNEERTTLTRLEGQLNVVTKLEPKELRDASRVLGIEDAQVTKLVDNLQATSAAEVQLSNQGLGENHPRLKTVLAEKEFYLKELSNALNTTRQSLATRLEGVRENLKSFEDKLDKARKLSIEEKAKIAEYVKTKSKHLQDKHIFEAAQIKLSTEMLDKGIDVDPAIIREKAEPSGSPAKPNVPAYLMLATVIGLVVGIGLAFFIEYLDTSVKTLEDIEKHLQIPVLAVVPKEVATLIKTEGDTPDAEAYRMLRANVEFNKPSRNANTFTLVSGGPGEGKSTTLNNLAFTCAQGGYNVLVVDADLRRPTQHKFFDQENSHGLVDYLMGNAELVDIVTTTKLDNLSFIPSGQLPGESVGILNSQRMVDLIAKVKGQYDLVFFDSPPILGVSDGSVLASECDITIMVVQHRRFPRAMLQRVKQAVANAGGKLIGVVLNNVDSKHDDGYSYYNSYSDYYATPRSEKKKINATAAAATPRHTAPPPPPPATASAPAAPARPRTIDQEDY
jgi:capsular exopolysaccharide synthesis family protein